MLPNNNNNRTRPPTTRTRRRRTAATAATTTISYGRRRRRRHRHRHRGACWRGSGCSGARSPRSLPRWRPTSARTRCPARWRGWRWVGIVFDITGARPSVKVFVDTVGHWSDPVLVTHDAHTPQPVDRLQRVRAFLGAVAPTLPPPPPASPVAGGQEEDGQQHLSSSPMSPAIVDGSGGGAAAGIPGRTKLFAVPLGEMPMPVAL